MGKRVGTQSNLAPPQEREHQGLLPNDSPQPPSRRMTRLLQVLFPFMAMHSPSPALSAPGTGRGRSQTRSRPPPSSAPATRSDSEFRADKQKQAQDTRQQALCHQMCTAAHRHSPSEAISEGNPGPRPSHALSQAADKGQWQETRGLEEADSGKSCLACLLPPPSCPLSQW